MLNYFKMPVAGKWARVWSQIATRISPSAFYQATVLTTYILQIHPALDSTKGDRDGVIWTGTLKQLSREAHVPLKVMTRLILESELFTATINGVELTASSLNVDPTAPIALSSAFIDAQIKDVTGKLRRMKKWPGAAGFMSDTTSEPVERASLGATCGKASTGSATEEVKSAAAEGGLISDTTSEPVERASLGATCGKASVSVAEKAQNVSSELDDLDDDTLAIALGEKPTSCQAVIDEWNRFHRGTRAEYRGDTSPALYHNLLKTFEVYSIEDLEKAFETARDDDFAWNLTNATKLSNVQLLLTKREKKEKSFFSKPKGRNVKTIHASDYTMDKIL